MESKILKCHFQVQIIAATEKSESVLQPRYYLVFSPYLEFRSPNDLNFFSRKIRQFPRTFMVQLVPILMLAMTFYSNKKIRIFTKSRVDHPLNNQSSNQQFQILDYKRRHLSCIQASWLFRSRSYSLFLSLYFCNV